MNEQSYNNPEFNFKTTPIPKIIILSILTVGLYELIWFYNAWKTLSTGLDYKISPFWRAFFCSVTSFFLFPIISKYIKKHSEESFPPFIYATLYILINATQRLDFPYWIISICSFFIIVSIQNKINKINNLYNRNAEINSWNKANTIYSILGCIFLCLVIIATIIPE